ncbi:hypothetical protein NIES37_50580 [Tolypothrix tenuis PCC 7101]|uniref:Uncharacterized protein n=1 Tax=Tolypothrix tenuis PCC 7101 TaxID=231146 RepID=A0A1Z4N5Q6_9CYAN|nr:hypothetical protein NIES37_50580 [Tolypothrix tenuis PCC 7101]BAZ75018.1 hypothetical protein NIES50_35980 [Aulosira laxa NIES-50]
MRSRGSRNFANALVGTGDWGLVTGDLGEKQFKIQNSALFPYTNTSYQLPITNYQLPITNYLYFRW